MAHTTKAKQQTN